MAAKLNIKLTIAGKAYPLSIDREKEQKYRRAERDINTLVAKFESRFRAQPEDYLAMTALQLAISNIESEMSRNLSSEREQLIELDKELDSYLNSLK